MQQSTGNEKKASVFDSIRMGRMDIKASAFDPARTVSPTYQTGFTDSPKFTSTKPHHLHPHPYQERSKKPIKKRFGPVPIHHHEMVGVDSQPMNVNASNHGIHITPPTPAGIPTGCAAATAMSSVQPIQLLQGSHMNTTMYNYQSQNPSPQRSFGLDCIALAAFQLEQSHEGSDSPLLPPRVNINSNSNNDLPQRDTATSTTNRNYIYEAEAMRTAATAFSRIQQVKNGWKSHNEMTNLAAASFENQNETQQKTPPTVVNTAKDSKKISAVSKAKEGKKKKVRKWTRPPDKPKRPLSAYNLFFRSERERMIRVKNELEKDLNNNKSNDKSIANSRSSDATGKVRGIGFGGMAKAVADRWNALNGEGRAPFEKIANEEKQNYFVQLEEWKREQAAKEQQKVTLPTTVHHGNPDMFPDQLQNNNFEP